MDDPFLFSQETDYANLLSVKLYEYSRADFDRCSVNTYAFNRCFLVREGDGMVFNHTAGERFRLRKGMALFMPESTDLSFEFHPGLKFLSCHFNLYLLPGVDVFQRTVKCREFPVSPEECENLEKRIVADPEWMAVCEFEAFFWKEIRHLPLPDGNALDELIRLTGRYGSLLRYIQEHLSAQLDISELADVAGLAGNTLSRNFSRDFSMPLKRFLQKELAAQASRLLLCTSLSIREIASRLQFSSEYYFSNFFKRQTGTTPSAFRKENCHTFAGM